MSKAICNKKLYVNGDCFFKHYVYCKRTKGHKGKHKADFYVDTIRKLQGKLVEILWENKSKGE